MEAATPIYLESFIFRILQPVFIHETRDFPFIFAYV